MLLLQHLEDSLESKAAVEEAVNALRWVHSLARVESSSSSPTLRVNLEGIQRMLAKPVQKKEPTTSQMLAHLVEYPNKHSSLPNLRLAAVCLPAYTVFLHFDELVHVHPCDVHMDSLKLKLEIRWSKTDQLRKGDEVPIARIGTSTFPVAMLELCMAMVGIKRETELYLFHAITKTKDHEVLRATGAISYSKLSKLFKHILEELGYPLSRYGIHSFRAGGATAAANVRGT